MNKIMTCCVFFIFGVGVGWIMQGMHWDIFFESYVPSLATLIAAYYGAKYAFQFQEDKERVDSKRRNVVDGNIAIFTLNRMTSALKDIQKQVIDPVRNLPTCYLQMKPILPISKNDIKLNIETMYFLLETDDRNLLGELVIEETRYQRALDAVNERSRLHREEVQPMLERAGIVQGGDYPMSQINEIIGNRLYITMQEATEEVIAHVDDTVVSLKQVADKLTATLKKHFPNEPIIGF